MYNVYIAVTKTPICVKGDVSGGNYVAQQSV